MDKKNTLLFSLTDRVWRVTHLTAEGTSLAVQVPIRIDPSSTIFQIYDIENDHLAVARLGRGLRSVLTEVAYREVSPTSFEVSFPVDISLKKLGLKARAPNVVNVILDVGGDIWSRADWTVDVDLDDIPFA